jgi:hypothetical protein
MPKFTSSLLQKKALDALLDSMADGLDHDNYDEMGAHRRGESSPEEKGTEFDEQTGRGFQPSPVVIPAADLPQSPELSTAEFFKEGEPVDPMEEKQEHEFFKEAPEFEISASGVRRVGKDGHSPEWQKIQDTLLPHNYHWLGRVSDGTEMWGKGVKERVVYDPANRTWKHSIGNVVDLDGSIHDLAEKIKAYGFDQATPKSSALKSCVACECGDCIEHDTTHTADDPNTRQGSA